MNPDYLFMFANWILATPIVWVSALVAGFLMVMVAIIVLTANLE